MRNKELLHGYEVEYKRLKRQLEFWRILLREAGISAAIADTKSLDAARNELLVGFKEKNIAKAHRGKNACSCCHYTGGPNDTPSHAFDFIYILVRNPNFQLPEPDWKDLVKNNPIENKGPMAYVLPSQLDSWPPGFYKCLMLGKKGCLLAQNRPSICLGHICDGAERVFGGYNKVETFLRKILFKHGGRGCGGNLLDFTWNWYARKVQPKIRNSKIGKIIQKFSDSLSPDLELEEIINKTFPGFTREEISGYWRSM